MSDYEPEQIHPGVYVDPGVSSRRQRILEENPRALFVHESQRDPIDEPVPSFDEADMEVPASTGARRGATCGLCKSEDIAQITRGPDYDAVKAHYQGRPFKAFQCHFCHARWSRQT